MTDLVGDPVYSFLPGNVLYQSETKTEIKETNQTCTSITGNANIDISIILVIGLVLVFTIHHFTKVRI